MTIAIKGKADPKAVAVARAVYEATRPESVILFGSRARGDYREDSDIDLMLVCEERMSKDDYMRAQRAAGDAARDVYGTNYGVDLLPIRKSVYLRCRGGINHVAAQAARDGVDMNGEKEDYEPNTEQNFDWEDVRQRVINTDRNLKDTGAMIAGGGSQEAIGFHAQQALENILKGWISALGISYGNTHDLEELLKVIKTIPEEMDTRAGEELKWLTAYAVEYRYWGAEIVLEDPERLHQAIARTVAAIEERIKELTGVDELPRYSRPTWRLSDDE